jgi:hypothetical protein
MPAIRLSPLRRRSSLAIAFSPAKPGIYGINAPSPRPFTFAPNVTPGTFVEPDSLSPAPSTDTPPSPTSTLFPPSDVHTPAPSRRRVPPGKRRSLGYIPRPPNAFMLFRADFVRQKHVPGSIETNHGSLSKIIGNCWKALPLEEKRVWEVKAKHAKAEHKARYPEYRFRPVHNKNKEKKKDKQAPSPADERRCEEVAQLLLEGKKGDELAAAVRSLDNYHNDSQNQSFFPSLPPHPARGHRRSSSVPLPNYHPGIALPAVPFLALSRPTSPVGNISRSNRMILGGRRASSARPAVGRSWTVPSMMHPLQCDNFPLPVVDTSLFEPSFLDSASAFPPYNFSDVLATLPHQALQPHDIAFGPLDPLAPALAPSSVPGMLYPSPYPGHPHSISSSTYSGSPANSEHALPQVAAPQPVPAPHMQPRLSALWKDFSAFEQAGGAFPVGAGMGMGYDGVGVGMSYEGVDMGVFTQEHMGFDMGMGHYQPGLENMFESPTSASTTMSTMMATGVVHDPATMAFQGFEYNDIAHE